MPLHWTYSFRMGALSSGPSSAIFTHSEWRPRVRVTCPAARALRTQFTAPKGADGLSGDMARGVALAEQSLAIVRDLGDLRSTAEALSNLALQAMNAGAYARAEALNGEALSLFAPWVTAGTWPSDSGRWASSRHPSATMRAPPRPWKRAWRCDASRGDAQGAAVSQATLGVVALNVGDLARARALLEEALETHRGRNDRWGQALVQAMLGHVELESGAVGRARELFGESAAGLQAIGNVLYLPWCLEGLVGVAAASGHAVRAARLCGAHEVLRERIGSAMLPLYPAGYERACATARAALSDADFAAAVAAGRSSPVEIVIAAALEPAGETAP